MNFSQVKSRASSTKSRSSTASNAEVSDAESSCSECENCKSLTSIIQRLESKVDNLQNEIDSLKGLKSTDGESEVPAPIAVFEERISQLEERLEERTNRQLRKTMVVRGIKEKGTEKKWSDTKKVLSEKIATSLDVSPEAAADMIDRCHRGGSRSYYRNADKDRPIYVAMLRWEDCKSIAQAARDGKINCNYKYGPRTTKRRNMALQKRKELRSSGVIGKAYIKYPACLMGIKAGEEEYSVIEDFSLRPVEIKPIGMK